MNAKFAVALILALQVSVSFCDSPMPSEELVKKYLNLRDTFFKRLTTAYNKLHSSVGASTPGAESPVPQSIKDFVEEMQGKPEFQKLIAFATDVKDGATPLVEKARMTLLGLYEKYFREHFSVYIDEILNNNVKPILDTYLPTE